MSETKSFVICLLLLTAGVLNAGQQEIIEPQEIPVPEPVFVRLTLYPTASLSRYDYNNDIDLYEVRAYAEIRAGSQSGEVLPDVRISVLSEELAFLNGSYEKRIELDKENLPDEVDISIAVPGRPPIRRTYPLPIWLCLVEPLPSIVESGKDLPVKWCFSAFSVHVNVRVYDFRKGDSLFSIDHVSEAEISVPADQIVADTIVRIYVMQSWLFKHILGGDDFARGSEINIIPWSQVFIRTK